MPARIGRRHARMDEGHTEPSASAPREVTAAARMLVDGCAGAALIVGADSKPSAANARAGALRALLEAGAAPEVAALIAQAAAARTVAYATLTLPGEAEGGARDVIVVPLGDESLLVFARDLTLTQYVRAALVESRQRYKDLVEASTDFAWEVGPDGAFVFISPKGALGFAAAHLIGRPAQELVLDQDANAAPPFTSRRRLDGVETWLRAADGAQACVILSAIALFDASGTWRGTRGVAKDVTAARALEDALARARSREQLLHQVVSTFRGKVDPADMLAAAAAATAHSLNAEGCRIYRRAADGVFIAAAELGEAEAPRVSDGMLKKLAGTLGAVDRGGVTWRLLGAATRHEAEVNGAVVVWSPTDTGVWSDDDHLLIADIAGHLGIAIAQIDKHERVARQARTDALTQLLNRRAFCEDELPRRLARLRRTGASAALFYIDLDNFKQVNDRHGHRRGDEALLCLCDVLRHHARPSDVIARLGGDEFAMWMEGMSGAVAETRRRALIAAGRELARFLEDGEARLGLSVGVAVYEPGSEESLEELMGRADAAMYADKRARKEAGGAPRA